MNRQGEYGAAAGTGGGYAYGEKSSAAAKSNRKWWWIGGGVILLIAVIAIIAGVVVSRNNSKSDGNGGLAGVVNGDKNDPSKFTKDPRFHQSFWGMCYTPLDSQYPACGDTLDSVIEDIQIFSQLTKRLRLYGSDCNIAEYVLHAINVTKVDMTVWLTAWLPQPADDPDGSTYQRQVKNVQDAIKKWGVDHIEGVAVGNEYLLNGGSEASLIQHMADMRTALAGMNLSKTVPVGTGDAGSKITETLAAGSDFIQANNHPWFGGVPVEQSGGWVWDYTANNEPATAKQAPNNPKLYVAEVGWPSGANETRFMTEGAGGVAVAGVPNVQILLDTYVCQANTNLTNSDATFDGYMWFEALAEPWKDALYGGVEAYWGLFDKNKKLLDGLTIPDCTSP
ncbi:FAMILY 17 GLUCOSIDASE SCW10-RELATED [Ceraceosorus bombacis]|uniref:glucan endo-1,3-beta-D-glucosidase n=1 Tax=Ceraceosorus bombacis TaxID=401625 RepID=A0A0P1BNA4_9BASI|nr:FAMILY 17 GLUCOSIDASE SCW10-RELATED [Ceraceosorus bombacis]